MSWFTKMDGDLYVVTLPSDEDWREAAGRFPSWNPNSARILVRRQNAHSATLVDNLHATGMERDYMQSEKMVYAEALNRTRSGSYRTEYYADKDGIWNFWPMLVPLDAKTHKPLTKCMAEEHEDWEIVTGGSFYCKDQPITMADPSFSPVDPKLSAVELNTDFKIGDSCLDEENSLLRWFWRKGNLYCMNTLGYYKLGKLERLLPVYEPVLNRL